MTSSIYDVAKQAGVSISTVSLVLQGGEKSALHADETVKRVKEAARQLRYKPSRRALSTAKGKNHCITIFAEMAAERDTPYHCMLFAGAATELCGADYTTEIVGSQSKKDLEHVFRDTDGAILAVKVPEEVVDKVLKSGLPVVWANMDFYGDTDCVAPDDASGSKSVGKHIKACGYEQVFYVRPPAKSHRSIRIRRDALAFALSGIQFHEIHPEKQALCEILNRVKKGALRKTAFVGYSNVEMNAVIISAMDFALRAPDDFGLASCHLDNFSELCSLDMIATGSTHQITHLGAAAGKMILEKIENAEKSIPSVLVPQKFIEGNTTRAQ